MPSEETVVSELRAALLSSKTPLQIQDVNSDFRSLNGYYIPFEDFGHKSLEEFLTKLKDKGEITMKSENGTLMVHAIPKGTSAHLTSLIRKQKAAKKKNSALTSHKFSTSVAQNMSNFIPKPREPPSCAEKLFSASLHSEPNFSSTGSFQKEALYSDQDLSNEDEAFPPQSSTTRSLVEPGNSNEHPAPLNLFQDECRLKLDTLPKHYRNDIENLMCKINYQINYFCFDKESTPNDVQLICKICCKTLHIAEVEEHVGNQEHLSNLTKRCESTSKTTAAVAVKEDDWDFLDFDESAQCYQCTLCRVKMSDSCNSWIKHFESNSHLSKLKTLNSDVSTNPASAFKSTLNSPTLSPKKVTPHVLTSNHQPGLNKNAFNEVSIKSNKKILNDLLNQFNCRLYVFQLVCDDVSKQLHFVCKVCSNSDLSPEQVKNHVDSKEHKENLRRNPFSLNAQSLNDPNKQILRELTTSLKEKINDFNLVYKIGTEELRFNCKYCFSTLTPQKVGDHIKTSKHVRVSSVKFSQCFETTKELNPKLKPSEFNLQSIAAGPSKAPGCSVTLPHVNIQNQNVTAVSYKSLNATDKKIVQKVQEDLSTESIYFNLVNAVNTKNLYFNCRLCDVILKPANAKNHTKEVFHIENLTLNFYFNTFSSLEEPSKKILRRFLHKIGEALNDFSLLCAVDGTRFQFKCKFCDIILFSDNLIPHLTTEEHQKLTGEKKRQVCGSTVLVNASQQYESKNNLDHNPMISRTVDPNHESNSVPTLSVSADLSESLVKSIKNSESYLKLKENDFLTNETVLPKNSSESEDLNDLNKDILKTLIDEVGIKLNNFSFVLNRSNELRFKCKFCSSVVNSQKVVHHVNCAKHLRYSQISHLGLESLKDGKKFIVRKLYDKIGSKINNYDLTVSLNFVCKMCGANLTAETIPDHDSSCENMKHFPRPNSENDRAAFTSSATYSQDLNSHCELSRPSHIISSKNIHDQRTDFSKNYDAAVKKEITDNTNRTSNFEEFQDDGMITSATPAESRYHQRHIPLNALNNLDKKNTAIASSCETKNLSESPLGKQVVFTAKAPNNVRITAAHDICLISESISTIRNSHSPDNPDVKKHGKKKCFTCTIA